MHSMSTLGPADLTPLISPGIRRIGFAEDPAQFTVANLLVHGWGLRRENAECTDPPTGDFASWSQSINTLSVAEREALPRDDDQVSVHTPWREQIYYMWNHVFFDVGNWVTANYGTGRFEPPGIEVFEVRFPASVVHDGQNGTGNGDGNGDGVAEKNLSRSGILPAASQVWPESETLLAAAYLAPGISLRVETLDPGQSEDEETFHPGDFTHGDRYTVWYVKKGLQLRIFVEGGWEEERVGGLAAVMVWGSMSGERIVYEESEEDDEEEGAPAT
ncbi:hypothetical protein BJX66DRAFT_311446 [Aspergillus keveii]|uniref:Uncharacterized protein n=1 Tax=Aspergillus keveii TaxID=714993 RepID=A0ABR4FV99_9EURO